MKKEQKYLPDYIFNGILDVTPEFLASHGIKGVLCDTDNTLALDNRSDIIPEAAEWIKIMNEAGIKVCLMSNSFYLRNRSVINALGLKYWHTRCHKPKGKYYNLLPEQMGLKKSEVCMLGDQMKTDIAGANNADIVSLYVMPYAFETNFFTKFVFRKRRKWERDYFRIYNNLHSTQFDFPEAIKSGMKKEDAESCVY